MNFLFFLIVAAVIGSSHGQYSNGNVLLQSSAKLTDCTQNCATNLGHLLLKVSNLLTNRRKRSLEMPQDGRFGLMNRTHEPLDQCHGTIEPGTKLYVDLKAVNLTGEYNVLFDRCYTSISRVPSNDGEIIPCDGDENLNNAIQNGTSQVAHCSFLAFRFTEQQDQTVSTYYLHCSTRLVKMEEDDDNQSNIKSITSPEIRVYRCPARPAVVKGPCISDF